jgi:phage shock protein A
LSTVEEKLRRVRRRLARLRQDIADLQTRQRLAKLGSVHRTDQQVRSMATFIKLYRDV